MAKPIKLRIYDFNKTVTEEGLSDAQLADAMGISTTQLWRARLPEHDPRHNDPGPDFIAGALTVFPNKKFEDLFFLRVASRERNKTGENLKIGKRIRAARTLKGLSQARLSELSGVSQAYLSELEAEEKNPTLAIVEKLSSALGVTIAELLGEDPLSFTGTDF